MKIVSGAFENEGKIPEKYTADGEDINPRILISEIPNGTKSLVLIVDDPDAQRVVGHTWIHWVVFDIPVEESHTIEIYEDTVPGKGGLNSFRKRIYGGPSPPPGTGIHNYYFKVFAIDKMLDLPELSELEEINEEMMGHVLDTCEMVGQYWRD